jgi:superfamily II DNA helicase RecQ
MGEGDYARVRDGLNATTERQQSTALRANDQDAADRGIFTSLNALRLKNDTREAYAPQFAANDATTVQMKAQDVAGANTAAMENANRVYESKWRPADYKAGLWNGTGGVVSSGTSGGWSI